MTFNPFCIDSYLINESERCDFCYDREGNRFDPKDVREAIVLCNGLTKKLNEVFAKETRMSLLDVIDKKQTGAFVGSMFISKFVDIAEYLGRNPSPTGHPDLVPAKYLKTHENYKWDQFPHGGLEIKTSCGSLPSGKTKDIPVGCPRREFVTGIVWKGHHTEINNLLGLFWDYYPVPCIFGAFYSNKLEPRDFTNTVPKKGGGHTTNVCITKSSATTKMGRNWVVMANEKAYLNLFEKLMDASVNTLM
jgi:hypothetical protein